MDPWDLPCDCPHCTEDLALAQRIVDKLNIAARELTILELTNVDVHNSPLTDMVNLAMSAVGFDYAATQRLRVYRKAVEAGFYTDKLDAARA